MLPLRALLPMTERSASPLDLGPNLMAAYRQLDMAGCWLEKLQTELGEALARSAPAAGFRFFPPETDSTNIDHYDSGEGWVLDGWRWTYPAQHRRHRLGELSVVLDLGRPGRAASIIGMPCMVVMWSTAAHNWAGIVTLISRGRHEAEGRRYVDLHAY